MAHHQSAIKRIRTSEKARVINRKYKTELKNSVKELLSTTDKSEAENKFKETSSMFDTLAQKKIIHKNKAANQKSRLSKFVKNLA